MVVTSLALAKGWAAEAREKHPAFFLHSFSLEPGPDKGVIMKGVFSLEESLETLNSLDSLKFLDSLKSLENGRILLGFHSLGIL